MNTKAEVLAKILADLPSAGDPPISAADLRGVLEFMAAQESLAEETSYTNDFQPLLSNVKQFLDALLNANIPLYSSDRNYASGYTVRFSNSLYTSNTAITAGGDNPDVSANWDSTLSGSAMTAAEIRDLLQTLTGANRLNKSAIQGADFALNRRGKGDVTDTAGFQMGMTNRLKGDFWIYDDGLGEPPPPIEGDTLENGDWVVALVNNATLHSTDSGYLESAQWWVVKFGGAAEISATSIRDLLETLTGPDMLNGAKVKYDASTSVAGRIATIIASLVSYQKILSHMRITVGSGGADSISVEGNLKIKNMVKNHLTYFGKQGTEGNYAGLDYVYTFVGGNTMIHMNPGLGLSFESGATVDLEYEE